MIDWKKYGFHGTHESEELKEYEKPEEFPFILYEKDGFIGIKFEGNYDGDWTISEGCIPATNQSVVLLLKAFAVKREKS